MERCIHSHYVFCLAACITFQCLWINLGYVGYACKSNVFIFDTYGFAAELFVNGEIVQRSPERQRRVEPVPQRASDRPRYNDRTHYARRRENQQR
jgi:hypothetical protein